MRRELRCERHAQTHACAHTGSACYIQGCVPQSQAETPSRYRATTHDTLAQRCVKTPKKAAKMQFPARVDKIFAKALMENGCLRARSASCGASKQRRPSRVSAFSAILCT
jgi:hypothetical protein